ncbi:protein DETOXIFICATION 12-like isoform X5 [Nymphaea colorata]|uniref:protein DETOXIFICATION 12-like isoform X5 n=1 Tax=Nymphaea colorata TaxID=210225 RepID=UPI00214F348E|nr:protein DETOXIFICATION 12-like isoform X5 [Nymphaea colorata]
MEEHVSMGESLLVKGASEAEISRVGGRGATADDWLCWGLVVEEARRQVVIALPLALVTMVQFLLQAVSLMMVGHLGSLYLSSTSISSSLCNVTGYIVLLGMASALETLCGQAYGAEQYQKVGVYTQKAIVTLLLVCIPITLLWFYMEKLLILIGQDHVIAHEAGKYAVFLIPGLFGAALVQPLVKFLQSQSLVLPLLFGAVVTLCFHVLVCWLLVFKFRIGHVGAAISVSLSYWMNLVILALYIKVSSACKKTISPFTTEAFARIQDFLGLALPSAVMICLEYWTFELMILLSGLLPDPKVQASVLSICVYTLNVVYSIPYGLGAAASTRISNELGAGWSRRARSAVFVVILLAVIDMLIVNTTLYAIRYLLGYAYSSEKEVSLYVVRVVPLVSLSSCMDAIQAVLSGVARGCGWQHLGAYVNLGAFYLFGLPISAILGFYFHFGAIGLWFGVLCGSTAQAILLSIITALTDWQKQVDKARDRVIDKPTVNNC